MNENELNEYRKKEREQVRYLIRKYFWWLVDEYGLTHLGDYAHFQNDKVWVEIGLGHKTPRVYLCRVGDDTFSYMSSVERIIEFLDKSFKWTRDTLKYTLEENVIYISDLFRRYADQLLLEFDSWWIPYKVAFYKRLKKEAEERGSLALFLKAYRYLYDYLIANGVSAEELMSHEVLVSKTEQTLTTPLTLHTTDFGWLLLLLAFLFGCFPTSLLLIGAASADSREELFLLLGLAVGYALWNLILLLFLQRKAYLTIDPQKREVYLVREYLVGIGKLGRKRLRVWKPEEITEVRLREALFKDALILKDDRRRVHSIALSHKQKHQAIQFIQILQGLNSRLSVPDIIRPGEQGPTALDAQALQQSVVLTERLLYIWGVLNIFSGSIGMFLANASRSTNLDLIDLIAGIIYLICGLGIRKRFEFASWLAVLVMLVERSHAFFYARSMGSVGTSQMFGWIITFLTLLLLINSALGLRALRDKAKQE